jgi:2-polyprenyl-6-methoxyphenol hydroxylase-like FAD-dependent oxidoreductase
MSAFLAAASRPVFADGSQATGDLLIAADGIRSTVRSQFLPDVKPVYAGYVGWRALVPEREVAPATRAVLEREYLFCVPEGELALCYAVPARDGGARVGHRDYNLVWYRPVDEAALTDLCTDAQGRQYDGSIPPPLIRPEVIADLRQFAKAELPPPLLDVACWCRGDEGSARRALPRGGNLGRGGRSRRGARALRS